jgi:hypothetical protein
MPAGGCLRPSGPRAFPGGDLEQPGVFEAFLASRASATRELIFLSVGDTRDHRRQYKAPALRTISTDFLLNLLANLRALDIEHHAILTTPSLCGQLQRAHCEFSCAWTSLWHSHPGLDKWSLQPLDMFLMWQQQWRYVARALEMGYRVLRADTDVYFAESPYPILNGPLLSDAAMVSMPLLQDLFCVCVCKVFSIRPPPLPSDQAAGLFDPINQLQLSN